MKNATLINAVIAGVLVLLVVLLFGCIQPPNEELQTPESLLKNPEGFLDQNVKVQGVLGEIACTEMACIPENICCNSCGSNLKGELRSITVSGKDCAFKGLESGKTVVLEGIWKKNPSGYYLELQSPSQPKLDENAWLSIIPIQCQGNAWDKWHKDLNRVYIRAPTEKEIMSEWLQAVYEVKLLDYKSVKISDAVCDACSCSRGDKVFIKVSKQDSGKLLSLSSIQWIVEEPPENQTPEEFSCVKNEDCIKTVLGCCPCSAGGMEIAVNAQWLAAQAQPACEQNPVCPQVFVCTEKQAFCEQEKCVLK